MSSLPLNLQFAILAGALSTVAFVYIAWAGEHGIRDLLADRREARIRAAAPRGATRC